MGLEEEIELSGIAGLGEKVIDSRGQSGLDIGRLRVPRESHQKRARKRGETLNPASQFVAIHAREDEVKHDHFRVERFGLLKGLMPVCGLTGFMAPGTQEHPERATCIRVIIDDQNAKWHQPAPRWSNKHHG
jgi:hypothetical protein